MASHGFEGPKFQVTHGEYWICKQQQCGDNQFLSRLVLWLKQPTMQIYDQPLPCGNTATDNLPSICGFAGLLYKICRFSIVSHGFPMVFLWFTTAILQYRSVTILTDSDLVKVSQVSHAWPIGA